MIPQRFEARRRFGAKLGIVTAMVACAGCTMARGGEETSADAPASAPAATADAITVSIQGMTQASDGSPVAGVEVCLRTNPTTSEGAACTTSDDAGAWKLAGAPASAWVAVTFVKDGFFPTLRPIATATSDITIPRGDGSLVASAAMSTLMSAPLDPASGHVVFSTSSPGTRATVAATVSFSAIGGPPVTPVYLDANGDTMPGANAGATGAFANVSGGFYEITFAGTSVACKDMGGLYGYPVTMYMPDGLARLLVPVVPGFLTAPVAASCTPVVPAN
jgi:hypothetical protein